MPKSELNLDDFRRCDSVHVEDGVEYRCSLMKGHIKLSENEGDPVVHMHGLDMDQPRMWRDDEKPVCTGCGGRGKVQVAIPMIYSDGNVLWKSTHHEKCERCDGTGVGA